MKDYLKNFGMLIPSGAVTIKREEKHYTDINELMDSAYNKYHWCNIKGDERCACLGCMNNLILTNGFTKEDWEKWVIENPQDKKDEDNDDYRFTTYSIF